jgi:hypothetical protein
MVLPFTLKGVKCNLKLVILDCANEMGSDLIVAGPYVQPEAMSRSDRISFLRLRSHAPKNVKRPCR